MTTESIGAIIKTARTADGMSLRAVARVAGCSHVFLSKIERGEHRTISRATLADLAHAIPSLIYADLAHALMSAHVRAMMEEVGQMGGYEHCLNDANISRVINLIESLE